MNKLNIFCLVTLSSMFMAVYAYSGMLGAGAGAGAGAGLFMNPMYTSMSYKPMLSYAGYSAGFGGAGGAAQGIWSFLVFSE